MEGVANAVANLRKITAERKEDWCRYLVSEYLIDEAIELAMPADITLIYGGQNDDFNFNDGQPPRRRLPKNPRTAYLCSVEKLMKASAAWKGMVSNLALLAGPDHHIVQEIPFRWPLAVNTFLAAAHGRPDSVPKNPSLDLVFQVAVYCREQGPSSLGLVGPYLDGWIEGLYNYQREWPRGGDAGERAAHMWKWLWVAYEFGLGNMLASTWGVAMSMGMAADIKKLSPALPRDEIVDRMARAEREIRGVILERFRAPLLEIEAAYEADGPVDERLCVNRRRSCLAAQRMAIIEWFRLVRRYASPANPDDIALDNVPCQLITQCDLPLPPYSGGSPSAGICAGPDRALPTLARTAGMLPRSPYSGPELPNSPELSEEEEGEIIDVHHKRSSGAVMSRGYSSGVVSSMPSSGSSHAYAHGHLNLTNTAATDAEGCECFVRRLSRKWAIEKERIIEVQLCLRDETLGPLTEVVRYNLQAQRQAIKEGCRAAQR